MATPVAPATTRRRLHNVPVKAAADQLALFGAPPALPGPPLPTGWDYRTDFVDAGEEAELLALIATLPLHEARYKGYTARRRIANFGTAYDYDDNRLLPGPPLPPELEPLRAKAAAWVGEAPEALSSALVAEYKPGVPLGWHRDVPDFETVVGISLAGTARMRFRRYPPVQPKKAGRALARARAALGVRAARGGALGLAAQRRADAGAALLDHVSNALGARQAPRHGELSPRRSAVPNALSVPDPASMPDVPAAGTLAGVDQPIAIDAQDRDVLGDEVADVEIAAVVAEDRAFRQAADLDLVGLRDLLAVDPQADDAAVLVVEERALGGVAAAQEQGDGELAGRADRQALGTVADHDLVDHARRRELEVDHADGVDLAVGGAGVAVVGRQRQLAVGRDVDVVGPRAGIMSYLL